MGERGPTPQQITPAERAFAHLLALRRRWWLLAAVMLITGGGAYVLSSRQQSRYDATAKVLLSSAEPINLLSRFAAAPSLDPERDLNTDIALVKLDSAARQVRRQLKLPWSSTQLLRKVSVSPQGLSNLVEITARDPRPLRAAAIANAFAKRYIAVRRQQAQAAYQTAAERAQRQLAVLSGAQRRGAQGALLRAKLHQLETTGELQTGGAQLIDPATVPTSTASPRPRFAAGVGAFVGLLLGALAALAAGVADRRRAHLAAAAARNGNRLAGAAGTTGQERPLPEPGPAWAPFPGTADRDL
jgi:succinoglycan biosynthesis transport protein ExoP